MSNLQSKFAGIEFIPTNERAARSPGAWIIVLGVIYPAVVIGVEHHNGGTDVFLGIHLKAAQAGQVQQVVYQLAHLARASPDVLHESFRLVGQRVGFLFEHFGEAVDVP